jgi:hypothetical protein
VKVGYNYTKKAGRFFFVKAFHRQILKSTVCMSASHPFKMPGVLSRTFICMHGVLGSVESSHSCHSSVLNVSIEASEA